MVAMLALKFRTRRALIAVVPISSLLLLTHQASSFGFPRNRMSSHPVVMEPNKVPGLINRIDTGTRGLTKTDLLGGAIATKSAQPTIGLTEILGGTSLLGGTKTRPNGTGIIVLGGTRRNRPPKGVIRNEIVRRRRVIIKLLV